MPNWNVITPLADGNPVPYDTLNKINENTLYLRAPNRYQAINLPAVSINTTSFTSLGAAYETTLTTTGGSVFVSITGTMRVGTIASGEGWMDIEVDGSRLGDTLRGLATISQFANAGTLATAGNLLFPTTFMRVISGLAAGSHTFKIVGKVSINTTFLTWGAGHHLFIREM